MEVSSGGQGMGEKEEVNRTAVVTQSYATKG